MGDGMSYPQLVLDRLPVAELPWFDAALGLKRLSETLAGVSVRETWKYTPIKSFVEGFAEPKSPVALETSGLDQAGISAQAFSRLNGDDLDFVRHTLASVDGARYPVADLTLLDSTDGLLLNITGQPERPLTLRASERGHHTVVINVAAGATLHLVEESTTPAFNAQLVVVRLAAGAHVSHTRCALEPSAMHWSLLMAHLDTDASYELWQFQTGGQRRRTDCHIKLAGQGARADLTGAYLTEDGGHLDQQVVIEHQARDTGNSRAIFNGRIHIHPNAGGSDALLSNRNLSLDAGTEIDTKPELEIYTDDVRCAHGATVGQLSEDAMFYLRSRGMSETVARSLLCGGFLRECIAGPLAEKVSQQFTGALQ
jgi:Fe-S cluster assembly protein SufD